MQIIGWVLVFVGLIVMNELGRRTKTGGMIIFVIIPAILTLYFILAHMGMFGGKENPTVAFMDGWFHYFKLYAADIGCVGFMMIKYKWGLGKKAWFKWWPWFIVAYDIWNFEYTYVNLPTHTWYCGVALLLAPTFANALWNKGGWIQNRANTLAIWCMWAQVVPAFQLSSRFAAALPSVYGGATENGVTTMDLYAKAIDLYNAGAGKTAQAGEIISSMGIHADPRAQGVVAMAAIAANVICIAVIIKRSIAMGKNPYSNEVFRGTKDFEEAMARARVEA